MAAKKKAPKSTKKILGSFEGHDVVGSVIAVVGAGDGLSKAMEIEAQTLKNGQEVDVLLRCVVSQVAFPNDKDDPNHVVRKHRLDAQVVTIVDSEWANDAIEAMKLKIEEHAGITRIPFAEVPDDERDV